MVIRPLNLSDLRCTEVTEQALVPLVLQGDAQLARLVDDSRLADKLPCTRGGDLSILKVLQHRIRSHREHDVFRFQVWNR